MKKTMRDTTKTEFQKVLTETLFSGKHTKSTIARLKNLYDPKGGRTAGYDLVIYSQIDFSKQNDFFDKIEKMTSDPTHRNYFVNNIINGLTRLVTKIKIDSDYWGYPEGSLDTLKENVINLKSKLTSIASHALSKPSYFDDIFPVLGKDKPIDIITGLTNSMMDHKYDQLMGTSSLPLNRADGYVQCKMPSLMASKSLI